MRSRQIVSNARGTSKQSFGHISLTVPNKGLKVREALERYRAGTLEENTLAYYYDAYEFEGEDNIPDFTTMTPIEKLQLLAQKRKEVQEHLTTLKNTTNGETTGEPAPAG